MTLLDTALRYHQAGLIVLPNDPAQKFPAGLANWQTITPTEKQIRGWYAEEGRAIGVRDVEGLDFDNKGNPAADALLHDWTDLCQQLAPGLAKRLFSKNAERGLPSRVALRDNPGESEACDATPHASRTGAQPEANVSRPHRNARQGRAVSGCPLAWV
jgi:hypothetical protein